MAEPQNHDIDEAGRRDPALHRILTHLLENIGGADTTALEARIADNETGIADNVTAVATARAISTANSTSIASNETAITLNTAKQTSLLLGWASIYQSTAFVASKPVIADSSASAGDGVDLEQFVTDAVTYDGMAVDAGTYLVAGYYTGTNTSANPAVNVGPAFPAVAVDIDAVATLIASAPSVNNIAFRVFTTAVSLKIWCYPDSAVSGVGLFAMKLL